MRSADLFGIYVRGLGSLLGARGVTVYVASPPGSAGKPALSHHGELLPLPELENLAEAERFLQEILPELARLKEADPALEAVEVPSRASGGRLIGILPSKPARVPDRRQAARRARATEAPEQAPEPVQPDLWLGLRTGDDDPAMPLPPHPVALRPLEAEWRWLLSFAGEVARHSRRVSQILDDPVTGLAGRAEFQEELERLLEAARAEDLPLTLLMINPDDFGALNENISREAADEVIREIGERLLDSCRREDLVARYGSVVFASILVDTGAEEGKRRAGEILQHLHGKAFVDRQVQLRFSLGLASLEPGAGGVRQGLDLIRRADVALSAAKRAGGGCIATWEPGAEEEVGYLDRLTGIFTGQVAKDYRNMAVLTDTISVLAESAEPQALAARVVRGLHAAMKPDRVGLFAWGGEDQPELIYGVCRRGPASAALEVQETLEIGDEERRFLEAARRRRRALESREGSGADEVLAFAVPLSAGDEVLGVLFLAGRARSMSLDSSDLVFLDALATPVALALDRAHLTARQRRQEEQERKRLLAEVEELRSALRRTQIVYRSRQMEAALERVRRVAPTDATVLITGESGTGKELFARALHELSPRRNQPFVVVDCGAISTTLIESELFGHEKGAFTGAQRREPGRLVQADRGTLLLDEIGELPLEAQSRLLRFVQDKYVTPVGGRAGRTVDVRVLAATNRDLAGEVQAGRFRADLYHRLNVVRLDIPALRARPDDVRHLADHFVRMYALIYGRPAASFSPEAESAVLRHPWPGNVRELQNRVMRAVILSQEAILTPADLGFSEDAADVEVGDEAGPLPDTPPADGLALDEGDSWLNLRSALRQQVDQALRGQRPLAPLGRWLIDDLVQEANVAAEHVASRAAAVLGTPLTTFRRRLESAVAQSGAGWPPRPPSWPVVRACLARLLRNGAAGQNLLKQVPQVLVEEVLAKTSDARMGAALVGVTLRTYQRRCESLEGGAPRAEPGRSAGPAPALEA